MSSETKSFCACSQEKTPKKVSFYFFSPKKKNRRAVIYTEGG